MLNAGGSSRSVATNSRTSICDYPGSTHFFFDIGNANLLAFFDFPGLDLEPHREVHGGLHHVVQEDGSLLISVFVLE